MNKSGQYHQLLGSFKTIFDEKFDISRYIYVYIEQI